MIYERANIKDIQELVDLRIAYIESDQGKIMEADLKEMQKRLPIYFEKHLNKDIFTFIARDRGVIIATALLLIIEKPSNPHFIQGRVGEVLSVYTKSEYRHKGIATFLIKELINFSKEQEIDYIDLSATKDGYMLYKKIGFCDVVSNYQEMRYKIIK